MKITIGKLEIVYDSVGKLLLECITLTLIIGAFYLYLGIVAMGEAALYLISKIYSWNVKHDIWPNV